MPNGASLDWQELSDLTARYNVSDPNFEEADIIAERKKKFESHRAHIQKTLAAITAQGRFDGWAALYQPAKPGVIRVERIISREDALPHYKECKDKIDDGMTYAWEKIGLMTEWNESASRKLSYDIDHPKKWEREKAGTVLQAILSQQRLFLVEVLPRWHTERGGLWTHEGLDQMQTLQLGLNRNDILEDIGCSDPELFGLGDDEEYGAFDID